MSQNGYGGRSNILVTGPWSACALSVEEAAKAGCSALVTQVAPGCAALAAGVVSGLFAKLSLQLAVDDESLVEKPLVARVNHACHLQEPV